MIPSVARDGMGGGVGWWWSDKGLGLVKEWRVGEGGEGAEGVVSSQRDDLPPPVGWAPPARPEAEWEVAAGRPGGHGPTRLTTSTRLQKYTRVCSSPGGGGGGGSDGGGVGK
ncbi:hypothetical protein Pmani_024058 [Petrolisthes manimaculis]|uniref:Uncharacterized protein n=1 Tax=Petrolisthes manimaculis TaxID=1843537 RepID=A0AAE1P8B9_9EUCA|nr:hypothetical protein Pmani_024058 [Petrolisthes manimaculis]